jgi:AmmeMemoRadiSam system protein B
VDHQIKLASLLLEIIVPTMSSPNDQAVRTPAVAGRFYPADPRACREEAQSYVQAGRPTAPAGHWIGGIVPHAGWVCSAAVAGETLSAIAAQTQADVVVVFGAIHTPLRVDFAALDSHHRWALPCGESELAVEVEQRLTEKGNLFLVEERLHRQEHAVEVNVPLIQVAFPSATILPIEVPVIREAELIGRKTAQTISASGLKAVYLASSDFTHYGTNYGFTPAGVGPAAMEWAKRTDQPLLDLIQQMRSDQIIPEVLQRTNACGAGAIAAMLSACREAGATQAKILRHTSSYETLARVAPQPPTNAVGYAAVVVG